MFLSFPAISAQPNHLPIVRVDGLVIAAGIRNFPFLFNFPFYSLLSNISLNTITNHSNLYFNIDMNYNNNNS